MKAIARESELHHFEGALKKFDNSWVKEGLNGVNVQRLFKSLRETMVSIHRREEKNEEKFASLLMAARAGAHCGLDAYRRFAEASSMHI